MDYRIEEKELRLTSCAHDLWAYYGIDGRTGDNTFRRVYAFDQFRYALVVEGAGLYPAEDIEGFQGLTGYPNPRGEVRII